VDKEQTFLFLNKKCNCQ